MKTFLATYIGTAESRQKAGWDALSETAREQKVRDGIRAWHEWIEANKASIVDVGSPIGKTKLANRGGISDTKNNISGYTTVRAESHEAAARLFVNHPHFTAFPGDSVEIMECLPIPEM